MWPMGVSGLIHGGVCTHMADELWLASLNRSEVLADRFVLIDGPCQSAVGGYNDSSALHM